MGTKTTEQQIKKITDLYKKEKGDFSGRGYKDFEQGLEFNDDVVNKKTLAQLNDRGYNLTKRGNKYFRDGKDVTDLFDKYKDQAITNWFFRDNGQMYNSLVYELGGQVEASDFLLRAGIDGIDYPAGSLSGIKGSKDHRRCVNNAQR